MSESKLHRPAQTKTLTSGRFTFTIKWGDECQNGHNTLSITGEEYETVQRRQTGRDRDIVACGCLHDDFTRLFPSMAYMVDYHLCSTDGPMHYFANTLFFSSDKDCFGYRKGEQKRSKDGQLMWHYVDDDTKSRVTTSESQPPDRIAIAVPIVGDGKDPEFDAARRSAIWPDATEEQLQDREALEDHLQTILANLREIVESLGFDW